MPTLPLQSHPALFEAGRPFGVSLLLNRVGQVLRFDLTCLLFFICLSIS